VYIMCSSASWFEYDGSEIQSLRTGSHFSRPAGYGEFVASRSAWIWVVPLPPDTAHEMVLAKHFEETIRLETKSSGIVIL
jgi:hypothetical protein